MKRQRRVPYSSIALNVTSGMLARALEIGQFLLRRRGQKR